MKRYVTFMVILVGRKDMPPPLLGEWVIVRRARRNPDIGLRVTATKDYRSFVHRERVKLGQFPNDTRNCLSIASQVMLDDFHMSSYEEIMSHVG